MAPAWRKSSSVAKGTCFCISRPAFMSGPRLDRLGRDQFWDGADNRFGSLPLCRRPRPPGSPFCKRCHTCCSKRRGPSLLDLLNSIGRNWEKQDQENPMRPAAPRKGLLYRVARPHVSGRGQSPRNLRFGRIGFPGGTIMSEQGWKRLTAGAPWFAGAGKHPIAAYSEFMPPPRWEEALTEMATPGCSTPPILGAGESPSTKRRWNCSRACSKSPRNCCPC